MRLLAHPHIYAFVLLSSAVALLVQTARHAGWMERGQTGALTDFDAFHLAGTLGLKGALEKAYSLSSFIEIQQAAGGSMFMPWTYPPQFNLILSPLASMHTALAYFVFIAGSLLAYMFVLRRLAGSDSRAVLCAIFPSIALTIVTGQNGFLTGALIGLTCLLLLKGSAVAGIPLGLMTMKPHLGVTFAVYLLSTWNWRTIIAASITAVVFALVATIAFGAGIWLAFMGAVSEASLLLEAGAYQLNRMISAYAMFRSFGAPPQMAIMLQAVVSLAAIALVMIAVRRQLPQRDVLGLTTLLGLLISPYAYDYDLPIFGIALALLLPSLSTLSNVREQFLIVGLTWGASFWGLIMTRALQLLGYDHDLAFMFRISLGSAFMIAATTMIWTILQRQAATSGQDSRPGAIHTAANS